MKAAEEKRKGVFPMSSQTSMKALLESGVHFGHRTNKWDPRMRPYIFTERNGIHIIDLQQTVKYLDTAYDMVRDAVQNGGTVLFVGTKHQAKDTIKEEALRCGMPFVTERWLPGTLTNWITIFARIQELERLEKMRDSGEVDKLSKKEGLMISREITRLLVHLEGIRSMKRVPDMLFVIDVMREETAVHEANLKEIPVVALVDTNCNPNGVDYVVPSNDDAIRAIKLLVGKFADAVIEGKSMRKDDDMESAEGEVSVERREAAHVSFGLEEDVEEEELLGAATLAKLTGARRVIEEAAAEEGTAEAAAEAAPVAKKASARAETPEETPAEVAVDAAVEAEPVTKKASAKAEKSEETPAVEDIIPADEIEDEEDAA